MPLQISENKTENVKNQLEEDCEQEITPGPNADKKQTEGKSDIEFTQQPIGDSAIPKTPSIQHLQCPEEIPVPEIVRSKSQNSKSSSSNKRRKPNLCSNFMITAMSTSTPINKSKSASSKSDVRPGTPRPPKLINCRSSENLKMEVPKNIATQKRKYADVKSKISTHWAPSEKKKVAVIGQLISMELCKVKPTREEHNKLPSNPKSVTVVEKKGPPTQEAEKSSAPAEANEKISEPAAPESTQVVVDAQEEAECNLMVVYTKSKAPKVDPKEERMSTTEKVLLGVTVVGAIAVVGYFIFCKQDKVVVKSAPFFKTISRNGI